MAKKIETKAVKRTKVERDLTLLRAIENIVEVSRDSKLSATAKAEMAEETKLLAESFGISERQAIFFAICMEKGPRRVDFDDLARHLDVSNIRILSYSDDIDALVRRRLLRYHDVKEEDSFDIPTPVIKGLKHNEAYQLPPRTGLDCFGIFEILGQLFEDLNDDAITPKDLYEEVKELFADNPQVDFVRQYNQISFVSWYSKLLLLLFCHLLVNREDDDIRFGQMEGVFANKGLFNEAKAELRNDTHELIEQKLVEHLCEDGIASPSRYKLTESAKRTLLAEMKLQTTEEKIADVIKAKNLTPKEMFYVEQNQRQVDELRSLLEPEKYAEIRERMKRTGFRTGFACLFYGGPGTGKTETAYQLARATGRDIMVVDVPQIKSKWVGDSEKNIKALFERYRELVKKNSPLPTSPRGGEQIGSGSSAPSSAQVQEDTYGITIASPRGGREGAAPILLFNEADAIIGIRKQGAQSAVDKMENSIQNIILQEMETLDGIMIATTNLTQNLDTAFERRFLYKINFAKPDASVRLHLWKSMMPSLTDADARVLASGYDFSGGQIENISRKATINAILHGDEANNLESLTAYCNAERLDNQASRRKVGF